MRTITIRSVLLLSIVLLAVAPVRSRAATPEPAILRVYVETRSGMVRGTCVLLHRESRGSQTVLYLLTSARLLKRTDTDRRAGTRTIRILRRDDAPFEVGADGVIVPNGDTLDIAILRVIAAGAAPAPVPMIWEPPEPGSVFVISGFGQDGRPAAVPERVRFQATLRLLGDRDASGLDGCAGAPAIVEGGVFGLVTECEPGLTPSILPLSAARGFILRHVPGWRFDSSLTTGLRGRSGRNHADAWPKGE